MEDFITGANGKFFVAKNTVKESTGTETAKSDVPRQSKPVYGVMYLSNKVAEVYDSLSSSQYVSNQFYRGCEWYRGCINAIVRGITSSGFSIVSRFRGRPVDNNRRDLLQRFFEEPNDKESIEDLTEKILIALNKYGKGYLEIAKVEQDTEIAKRVWVDFYTKIQAKGPLDDVQIPFSLYNIPASTMNKGTVTNGVVIEWLQTNGSVPPQPLPADEVIDFTIVTDDEDIFGLSPFETARLAITGDILLAQKQRKFFSTSAIPDAHYKLGNGVEPEDVSAFFNFLDEKIRGKAHAVLASNNDITIDIPDYKMQDKSLNEYKVDFLSRILVSLGLYPAILGLTIGLKSADIVGQIRLFKALTLSYFKRILTEEINRRVVWGLFGFKDLKFKYNVTDALDIYESGKQDAQDLQWAVRTINEVRSDRGEDPVPWGNTPYNPLKTSVAIPGTERAQTPLSEQPRGNQNPEELQKAFQDLEVKFQLLKDKVTEMELEHE